MSTRPSRQVSLSPYARSQLLNLIFRQLHDELFVARVTPAIAIDAADEPLAVAVDSMSRRLQ
jgi:hypothetical protein